jgi:hypothetical protein
LLLMRLWLPCCRGLASFIERVLPCCVSMSVVLACKQPGQEQQAGQLLASQSQIEMAALRLQGRAELD